MKLRDYQIETIEETLKGFSTKQRQLIVLPTGSGKTVIFSHIIEKMKKKTLIIAHTKELVEQANTTCKEIIKSCPFEVSTIQKICVPSNFSKLKKQRFEFLVIDECHRSGADTYMKLINSLGDINVLGVTATPFRTDGQELNNIFSKSKSSFSIMDLIEKGFLCDFEGYRVKTNCSLNGVSTKGGEFCASSLASVINIKNRNELIIREFTKICPKDKTLCFTANINHAEELSKEFREQGYNCYAVHGKISPTLRKTYLEKFKTGEIQILINCQILTEGFDEPSIACLLMARPTKSKTLYIQMIGRGSRIFPGKESCKVIEFTDNDYDVCSIEDIIDAKQDTYKINHGEKLSNFSQRVQTNLLEESQSTVVEKFKITYKSIYDKPATQWQRSYLLEHKIYFQEPLSDYIANHLILESCNGNNKKTN